MKNIIKYIFMGFVLFGLSQNLMATEITVYPTSAMTGPTGNILNTIGNQTQNSDIKFNISQTNNCGSAVQKFKESNSPVAILMSNNQYKNSRVNKLDCVVDDFKSAKPIVIATVSHELCVKPGSSLPTNRVATLGITKFVPYQTITEELSNNVMGVKFKYVLFNSSGDSVQGIINGDVDAGFITLNNAANAIQSGALQCLYSTELNKFKNKPMSAFTGRENSFVNKETVSFMLVTRNLTDSDEQKLLASIKNLGEELKKQNIDTTIISPNAKEIDSYMKRAKASENLD